MKKKDYLACQSYLQQHPILLKGILWLSTFAPLCSFLAYFILLLVLLGHHSTFLIKAILVPASCFVTVTQLRRFLNRPRPFEVYQVPPLKSHSRGQSMPSRHSASALIIGLTIWQVHQPWGMLLILNALLTGCTRILIGVHFPQDVMSGFLVALLFSCFFLL